MSIAYEKKRPKVGSETSRSGQTTFGKIGFAKKYFRALTDLSQNPPPHELSSHFVERDVRATMDSHSDILVQSPTAMMPLDSSTSPTYPRHSTVSLPSQPDMPAASTANNNSINNANRRRKSSKPSLHSVIKRSASTPNVRGLASAEAAAALAEKRRNKLGYHRTSVACGA